jgi:flagellar biosynthesis protein FlhG
MNDSSQHEELDPQKKIFAVASGKGGTGKSTFAINLALGLAALGHEVILVDADLGGADISNLLGVSSPRYTLRDFLTGNVSYLAEVLEPTPSPRLRLILGGSEIISISNPYYSQKMKLIRNIRQLEADYIIVDLGPDITFNNLDFFNSAPVGFLVTHNVDAIIMGFYRFLKAAFIRRLKQEFKNDPFILNIINDFQNKGWTRARRNLIGSIRAADQEVSQRLDQVLDTFKPKLVFNRVKSNAARKTADQMFTFILENFGFRLQTVGFLPDDRDVEKAYARSEPYILCYPKGNTTRALFEVLRSCGLNKTSNGDPVPSHSLFSKYIKNEANNWQLLKI